MEMKKKFVFDLAFNIIATVIPIVVLQLVAYPVVARTIPDESYGLMITVFSTLQLISGTLGTGLNNVRLVKKNDEKESETGDFSVILIIDCLITAIITACAIRYYQNGFEIYGIMLGAVIALLLLITSYIEVEYRIKLNFKKILYANIANSIGYGVGICLFLVLKRWELIFLFGFGFRLIYDCKNTKILKEKPETSPRFKIIAADTAYIYVSGFCSRAISYADKILLLPLLGGASVSIYYTANLLGKVVLLGLNPVNSVILSYLSKKNSVAKKTFRLYLFSGVALCSFGYLACMAISRPILEFLFPQWVDVAMKYVPVTTLSLCIVTLCSFLTPFTLKFCDMHWQLVINATTMVVYITLSLALLNRYDLIGFCWGICISNFIQLIITLFVYLMKKNTSIES